MVAKAIRGQGIAFTPGAAGSGSGCLVSARFTVPMFGSQSIGSTDTQYIEWVTAEFDDLGLGSDWSTPSGAFFMPTAGDYLIVAYAQLEPLSSDAPGEGVALLSIETPDAVQERMSTAIPQEIGPKLSVSGLHRFEEDGQLQIAIAQFNGSESRTINAASVTITRMCDLSDGGGGGGGGG